MKKYIVKSEFSWADEIDLCGFDLFTEDKLQEAISLLKRSKEEYKEVSIGTNEEMEIEASEVLEDLESADQISDEAYMIMLHKLGDHYGFTKYDLWLDNDNEEDEEDINDDDEDYEE